VGRLELVLAAGCWLLAAAGGWCWPARWGGAQSGRGGRRIGQGWSCHGALGCEMDRRRASANTCPSACSRRVRAKDAARLATPSTPADWPTPTPTAMATPRRGCPREATQHTHRNGRRRSRQAGRQRARWAERADEGLRRGPLHAARGCGSLR